ncbi:MAG: MFS transporter [Bacillota bacterium]|nr:MFS transporter [Bacillota bacterium]
MSIFSFHKNIKIRLAESFLSSFISSMIFPFMAIYLTSHFGAKVTGGLLLINVFVGIAINFLGGYFSDHFGRKKIIVFSESLRLLAFLTMMLCNSPWFQSAIITFFMMTINSICWGLGGPANQAMLIDVSTPDQRKSMYSIMYWSNNLSIAIGGIFGGFLFKTHLFQLLIGLSVASMVTWTLITFFVEESYFPSSSTDKTIIHHARTMFNKYKEVFQDKLFIYFVLAGIFVLSMEFQLTTYISIRLSKEMPVEHFLSWEFSGIEMVGFLRTENTILVVLLALFATKIAARMKDTRTLLFSCFFFVIGYSIISYSNNVWLLLCMMILATVAEVLRVPVQQNYMAGLPPENSRSSYMAISGLTFNMAMLICSISLFISGYVNKFLTSLFIASIGMIGVSIFYKILPMLNERMKESSRNIA